MSQWLSCWSVTAPTFTSGATTAARRIHWRCCTAMNPSRNGCWLMAPTMNARCRTVLSRLAREATGRAPGEMLAAHPNLRGDLRLDHHLMMHGPAERGNAAILETMLAW